MDMDVTQLKKESIQVAASYPTSNGGGKHGYIGTYYEDAKYITFLEGSISSHQPHHPLAYPVNTGTHEYVEAEHKVRSKQYNEFLGIEAELNWLIIFALEWGWFMEKEDEQMDFDVMAFELLQELQWRIRFHGYWDT